MFEQYILAILGLWIVVMTIIVQQFVAVYVNRKSGKFIPGKFDDTLGPESFIFRSERTFRNSLENIIPFLMAAILAMFIDLNNLTLAFFVWVFAISRIGHMVAYYKSTSDKNPSAKSYFFIVGILSTVILMLANLVQIFTM